MHVTSNNMKPFKLKITEKSKISKLRDLIDCKVYLLHCHHSAGKQIPSML